ncbi:hypothetical protein [Acidiphilium acidophilum]|uniref:hypothetical protein n=1 Tax=Acidiphilium acidophilum TaxID=76588 RepID=UPI002E8E696F|nr:hypothetical protein [Acidiphilium acidophilum]
MKRSTVIVGLLLCTVVYLFGREHHEPFVAARSSAPRPNINQLVREHLPAVVGPEPAVSSPAASRTAVPRTAAEVIAPALPDPAARLARLKQEYRDHAGLRQLVADFNAETGHPGRGETASLQALDQDAVAGAPVFGLMQAVQPRAEMAHAFERHWRDERRRREDGRTAAPAMPTTRKPSVSAALTPQNHRLRVHRHSLTGAIA